jgi:hypothetical protein
MGLCEGKIAQIPMKLHEFAEIPIARIQIAEIPTANTNTSPQSLNLAINSIQSYGNMSL